MLVLGLDIGNAKVKLCLIRFQETLENSDIVWKSLPLPFTDNRLFDFQHGLPLQILHYCSSEGIHFEDLDAVVVCSSHSYSYTFFHDSIDHLAQILLKAFEDTPVYFVAADASLTPAKKIESLSKSEKYRFVLTNFVGSAHLARRLIRYGLSLDTGTTTTDIIPILDGQIDPVGLKDPDQYLKFRYQHQRINWYGLTIIPLHMLCDRVEISSGSFQVVPRNYRSDLIFSMLETTDQELMEEHAYDNLFPSHVIAREKICQFVGLDPHLLNDHEIREIRDFLYAKILEKVAAAISAVAIESFGKIDPELDLAIFALGEQLVTTPALLEAGFSPEHFHYLDLKREQKLWSASSAFAMAHLGLELLSGKQISLKTKQP